jgi:hypothetical protein
VVNDGPGLVFPRAVFEQKLAQAAQGTSTAVQDTATSRWYGRTEAGSGVRSCQESKQGSLQKSGLGKKPRNLLFLALSWLNLQAFIVHLVHVARRFHMVQNPLLEIRNRVERIRYVLILLYVANDFGSLGSFRKIDQLRVLDDRCNAVFDEGKICQVYSYRKLVTNSSLLADIHTQKWNAWRVGQAELFAIKCKVLRARHQLPH